MAEALGKYLAYRRPNGIDYDEIPTEIRKKVAESVANEKLKEGDIFKILHARKAYEVAGIEMPKEKLMKMADEALKKGDFIDAIAGYNFSGAEQIPIKEIIKTIELFLDYGKVGYALKGLELLGIEVPEEVNKSFDAKTPGEETYNAPQQNPVRVTRERLIKAGDQALGREWPCHALLAYKKSGEEIPADKIDKIKDLTEKQLKLGNIDVAIEVYKLDPSLVEIEKIIEAGDKVLGEYFTIDDAKIDTIKAYELAGENLDTERKAVLEFLKKGLDKNFTFFPFLF